jgi:hypothetical protein
MNNPEFFSLTKEIWERSILGAGVFIGLAEIPEVLKTRITGKN